VAKKVSYTGRKGEWIMLTIKMKDGETISYTAPITLNIDDVDNISFIQATDGELHKIRKCYPLFVSMKHTGKRQRFYGSIAKTILYNVF
jgi:hypothetical protein